MHEFKDPNLDHQSPSPDERAPTIGNLDRVDNTHGNQDNIDVERL